MGVHDFVVAPFALAHTFLHSSFQYHVPALYRCAVGKKYEEGAVRRTSVNALPFEAVVDRVEKDRGEVAR